MGEYLIQVIGEDFPPEKELLIKADFLPRVGDTYDTTNLEEKPRLFDLSPLFDFPKGRYVVAEVRHFVRKGDRDLEGYAIAESFVILRRDS